MSESKHTPGPWEATHRLNSIGQPLRAGRWVILQLGQNKREDFFIAEMPFAAVRSGDQREHEANARLIAAAPDLEAVALAYEAWEADVILSADWSNDTPRLTQAQWDRLLEIQGMRNAALAKARPSQVEG